MPRTVLVAGASGFIGSHLGGVLAPILTHLTWSAATLFALPPIFVGFS